MTVEYSVQLFEAETNTWTGGSVRLQVLYEHLRRKFVSADERVQHIRSQTRFHHHGRAPSHHDRVPSQRNRARAPSRHDKAPSHHGGSPSHHDRVPSQRNRAPSHHVGSPSKRVRTKLCKKEGCVEDAFASHDEESREAGDTLVSDEENDTAVMWNGASDATELRTLLRKALRERDDSSWPTYDRDFDRALQRLLRPFQDRAKNSIKLQFQAMDRYVLEIKAVSKSGAQFSSGFCLRPGLVLSTEHGVGAQGAILLASRGRESLGDAKLTLLKPTHTDLDLAVSRLEDRGVCGVSIGISSKRPQIGDELVFLGYYERQRFFAECIVNGYDAETEEVTIVGPFRPGCSGGVFVDTQNSRVVGILLAADNHNPNVCFARHLASKASTDFLDKVFDENKCECTSKELLEDAECESSFKTDFQYLQDAMETLHQEQSSDSNVVRLVSVVRKGGDYANTNVKVLCGTKNEDTGVFEASEQEYNTASGSTASSLLNGDVDPTQQKTNPTEAKTKAAAGDSKLQKKTPPGMETGSPSPRMAARASCPTTPP